MRKNERTKVYLDWKTGKRFALIGGILLAMGVGGSVANHASADTTVKSPIKSFFPDLPTDTHVNYKNAEPILHITMEDGTNSTLTYLFLDEKVPVFCVGLGIPLASDSVTAQADATNELFSKLTNEQQAIVNNVAFLARQKGDMEAYAEGRVAIYYLMDQYGVAKHKVAELKAIDGSSVSDMDKVKSGANDLIKEAKKMRELPSFNNQTIDLIQGVEKTVTDTKAVLPNFPYVKNNVSGLTESISGNDVKLKAGTGVKHGNVKNAIQLKNIDGDIPDGYTPYFIYSTDGDHTGDKSQSVIATKDPYQAMANLNVNIIGLGETTLLKHDADTNSTDTQGEAQLTGSVWGLYKAGTNTLVKYSDGQNGYPITVTNGEKVDDKQVQLKLTDLTKGVGVKNLDNSADYEWGEVKAPEGYELSTKRYKVHFDDIDKFDDKTSNYIDDVTALDRVLRFNFGYIKAQDVNGSLTGLNGRAFRLTPQGDTKGEPIEVTSSQSEDASGFINNGQVNFSNINFGDYLLEELPQDNDKLQLINPISVTTNTNKDKDGNITGYTVEFKDTVTQQVITTLDVPITKTTDNNTMFKVNLGTLVDKPVTPVVPTIKTQAHSKDGDKIIQINEVSEKTPIYDIADFTNVLKGDQILSYVHRVVTDKDGKVTSDKLLQTLKYVADDETVKTQQHRFDTTVDTTKDFDIPDGSKVTYVFTENDFDASANPETDEPKAKHDDLKDQDQTLTVDKVTPSIDVEKANAKVPDAGNGNHTDKDNNVGVNDHDTEDTYFEVKPKAETKIFFRGTNNGTEPLTHIKVVDKTTNGSVNIKGMTFTYNDKKLSVNKDGEFELDGKLLVLQPKESVIGSGTLDALPEGELHGDKVTIDGIGVYSKKHVSDDDKWYGKVDEKTKSIVEKVAGSLPTTGEGKAALGISIFGVALLGLAAYLKRQWIVTTYRRVIGKIRK
ncbi:LPXTG cell wall anchor domain-containing protein [Lactococcus lactis]|uniref:SpaA isopeptide-forming pilin-related protein n=1 Tax=Lactococcus lactis TaxID=1358 RepID=UPI0019122E05|nr:SpaA isopeptide-forming pilin-related protein [Lactococcus lactis]MBK5077540.1 LPXTG cell wall anchor domain-containing protein [Lactococcus lactis]